MVVKQTGLAVHEYKQMNQWDSLYGTELVRGCSLVKWWGQEGRQYSQVEWPLVGQQDPLSECHVVGEGERQGVGLWNGSLGIQNPRLLALVAGNDWRVRVRKSQPKGSLG